MSADIELIGYAFSTTDRVAPVVCGTAEHSKARSSQAILTQEFWPLQCMHWRLGRPGGIFYYQPFLGAK